MHQFKILFIFIALLSSFLSAAEEEITVYTYSSLTGKGSLTEALKKEWETKKRKIKFVAFSSSREALNQIFLEKEKTRADVVLGIDQLGIAQAQSSGLFHSEDLSGYAGNLATAIPSKLVKEGFIPFDYGYLAFVYDSSKVLGELPANFTDFVLKNQKAKRLILIDPRTSQLGLSFLAWTKLIWNDSQWESNMKAIVRGTKVWAPGWSAAYSLFQKGEGDYVISYTTSPAYHIEEEKKEQFRTLTFKEGHYLQIETAAITKASKNVSLAREFLKLLVSRHVQDQIPKLQWMYPVMDNAALLPSFKKIQKVQPIPGFMFADEHVQKVWLNSWNELVLSTK